MADAKSKLGVIRNHKASQKAGIVATLTEAMDDHATFGAVMVIAMVEKDDGSSIVRVYAANLNRLERLGLLLDAQDALLND